MTRAVTVGLLFVLAASTARAASGTAPAAPQQYTISFGAVVHTVDARYVSYVIDPASLEINPPGVYPPVMILQSTFLDWAPCFSQLRPGFLFPRIAFALP